MGLLLQMASLHMLFKTCFNIEIDCKKVIGFKYENNKYLKELSDLISTMIVTKKL